VETEQGTYVMTYTQWNHKIAILGIAISNDLVHWKKMGYAFEGKARKRWSKSGSIICRLEGNRMIATKIKGKYWMYWGEREIYAATSDDLISWEPLRDEQYGGFLPIIKTRKDRFDSEIVEAGPPALITKAGIVLLYNGQNSAINGDGNLLPYCYSPGQVLLEIEDPTKVIERAEDFFLTPERDYEMKGQYESGAVFIQGLVYFKNSWLLYYGAADSRIGVAIFPGDEPIVKIPNKDRFR
jgi:predicted GH43/DUF377 family glycosyl hydrolase